MPRTGRPRLPVLHGELAGARSHRNAGEEVCDECKAAEAKYRRDYRKRKKEGRR